jgi:MFS family permease
MIEKSEKEFNPSTSSIIGLNGLLFFISDIRHGIGPLFSIHLRSALQWDPAKIGFALAAVEFSAFLSQIPSGLLVDATTRKRAIISSACILIIIGCIIIYWFSTLYSIVFAQLLMGISIALISPTIGSITMGLFGRKKFPKRVGKNEVWNHAGNVFSALSVGLFGYFLGSKWIFIILVGFAIASLIFVSIIRPNDIDYASAREEDTTTNKLTPLKFLFKRKEIIIFNASLILYYMSNGAQMSLIGQILALKDPLNSSLLIAGCMIITELVMIVIAYIMSRIVNLFNRKIFFLIAFCLLPIRAILYTLVDSEYLFLLIQTLDGVAAGILSVIGVIINSDLAYKTGRFNFLQGVGAMSIAIGEACSQLFAGLIANFFGFNYSFFSLAFLAFLGILFFSCLMPETRKIN